MSRPTLRSVKRSAREYDRATRGMTRENHHSGLVSLASLARIQSAPIPPVVEYDAWLAATVSADPRGRTKLTGSKLRRLVQMRRNDCSMSECGRAIGTSGATAHRALHAMPAELGGEPESLPS